eukprot:scaffold658459_cov39-Prasinocladus_malaysianus.AAC.1
MNCGFVAAQGKTHDLLLEGQQPNMERYGTLDLPTLVWSPTSRTRISGHTPYGLRAVHSSCQAGICSCQ